MLKLPPNFKLKKDGTATIIVGTHYHRRDVMAERASIHEAAHACIGRVLGFECGGASIRDDGTGSANVAPMHSLLWDVTRDGDVMSAVTDKLVVMFSGPVVEDLKFSASLLFFTGRKSRPSPPRCS